MTTAQTIRTYRVTLLFSGARRHTTIDAGDTTEAATQANQKFPGSSVIEVHDEQGHLLESLRMND